MNESKFIDDKKETSLFPYYYFNYNELSEKRKLKVLLDAFFDLVNDKSKGEQEILNYIRDKKAYFIIVLILKKYYYFGHHSTFIFPEFKLGTSYRSDYLIVGKNSDGYHFLFIEFETTYGNITKSDGYEGESMRKGLNQVRDWDLWLECNFQNLHEIFQKYLNREKGLPKEFYKYDKSRIHYLVVVGRREDFNEVTYRIRRKYEESKLTLLHYDNLLNTAQRWIDGELF